MPNQSSFLNGRIYTRDELSVRRIIPLSVNPKTNFDEYFVYLYLKRNACYTTDVLVLSRVEAWREIKNNMAALVALLTNKWRRRALDVAVYQRRTSAAKRMPELENNLVNFMLPFSLANHAQDRKTRSRGEITSSKNRLRFRLDINLEMDHPSKTIYPSVSTSS